MKTLIRDNKVAVILGDYWKGYKDNFYLEWAFLPELVELLESDEWNNIPDSYYKKDIQIQKLIDVLLSQGYKFTEDDLKYNKEHKEETTIEHTTYEVQEPLFLGDCWLKDVFFCNTNLEVNWVDCNREFTIMSTDYGEYILYKDEVNWINIKN